MPRRSLYSLDRARRPSKLANRLNYISDRLALEDMHPANVFIDDITKKPICIDCIVKFLK